MKKIDLFASLEELNSRPKPFEFYTAADLWTDEHTSAQMLAYHLNMEMDVSSRRGEFIERSVRWIASHFDVGTNTRVADFGCGPGLYTNRLAKLGAAVTGIDFSRRSIEHARKAAAEADSAVEFVKWGGQTIAPSATTIPQREVEIENNQSGERRHH